MTWLDSAVGNARWCQLPLQLPCHEKAVSLSVCFPAKPRVKGQFSRQALCARQSAYGEQFQRGPDCNRPAGASSMQGYMNANAWKAKAVRQQMQGTP